MDSESDSDTHNSTYDKLVDSSAVVIHALLGLNWHALLEKSICGSISVRILKKIPLRLDIFFREKFET
jgi:hypothetical protein